MPGKIPLDKLFQQSPIGETNEVVPAGNTNIFQRALAEILGLPVDLTKRASLQMTCKPPLYRYLKKIWRSEQRLSPQ